MSRVVVGSFLACGIAVLLFYSLRSARAAYSAEKDSVSSLQLASKLLPSNAAYLARLAQIDTGHSQSWLDEAIRVHPRAAELWMERSVLQEMAGHSEEAERSLIHATRLNRHYVVRWTLAAYYFRQQDAAKFRSAAREALEMAYGSPLPLFQMAGALGISLGEMQQTMLPERGPVYRAFLEECIRHRAYEPLAAATRQLISFGSAETDLTVALQAVDTLQEAGRPEATEIWNQLAQVKWFGHAPVGENLVSNGDFSQEFLPGGFDWRIPRVDGVSVWRRNTGGLHVEFSGRQPQRGIVLALPLAGTSGTRYRLAVNAEAREIGIGKGLRWRLGDLEWEAAADKLEERFTLPGPSKGKQPALSLVYERAVGTKRVEGSFNIERVTISRIVSEAER